MHLEGFTEISPILRAGVYALCAKGRVIYVGKSKAMIARIAAHRNAYRDKRAKNGQGSWLSDTLGIPGLLFDEIHVYPCRLDELDRIERAMILKYSPHYNIQLKSQVTRAPLSVLVAGVQVTINPRVVETIRRRI